MKTRIAILDDYHDVSTKLADWSKLPNCEVVAFTDHVDGDAALVERLKDFDVVCTMRERTKFPRAVFEGLPRLKLLVVTGGRHTLAFDFDAALEHGVAVCRTLNSAPASDGSVRRSGIPELTFGLMVALMRQIVTEDRNIRAGRWISTLGRSLQDTTLGLMGLGTIGSEVAKVGKFFAMDVIAWSENLTEERASSFGAHRVEKDDLFRRADVVSVHMRLSERTEKLIGAREFALMKPDAYFINTSRGPIVDEAALIETLQRKQIAGAGLDVFEHEPLAADSPLRSLDNTVLTPHIGYVTESKYEVFYNDMIKVIGAWLDDAPIQRLKPPGPGESRSTGYWVDA